MLRGEHTDGGSGEGLEGRHLTGGGATEAKKDHESWSFFFCSPRAEAEWRKGPAGPKGPGGKED